MDKKDELDITNALTKVAQAQKPVDKDDEIVAGGIIERSLDTVLHTSMMPYSEYVILDRALPRV
ncbi:MAG: hypothetical protein IKC79_01120, partial [Clostridia bacterium]|nr:hypothetical protein [Clostridia bacterium]